MEILDQRDDKVVIGGQPTNGGQRCNLVRASTSAIPGLDQILDSFAPEGKPRFDAEWHDRMKVDGLEAAFPKVGFPVACSVRTRACDLVGDLKCRRKRIGLPTSALFETRGQGHCPNDCFLIHKQKFRKASANDHFWPKPAVWANFTHITGIDPKRTFG